MLLISVLIINLFAVCADAISDSGVNRKLNVGWFELHFFFWIRRYVPQLIVAFLLHELGWIYFTKIYIIGAVCYIALAWLLWELLYNANILGGTNEKTNTDNSNSDSLSNDKTIGVTLN